MAGLLFVAACSVRLMLVLMLVFMFGLGRDLHMPQRATGFGRWAEEYERVEKLLFGVRDGGLSAPACWARARSPRCPRLEPPVPSRRCCLRWRCSSGRAHAHARQAACARQQRREGQRKPGLPPTQMLSVSFAYRAFLMGSVTKNASVTVASGPHAQSFTPSGPGFVKSSNVILYHIMAISGSDEPPRLPPSREWRPRILSHTPIRLGQGQHRLSIA